MGVYRDWNSGLALQKIIRTHIASGLLSMALCIVACTDMPPEMEHLDPAWDDDSEQAEAISLPPSEDLQNPEPSFELKSIEPDRMRVNESIEVVLHGSGFIDGMRVSFGESESNELLVISDTMAVMRPPPREPGLVDIHAWLPDTQITDGARLEQAFLYYSEVNITEVTPASGPTTGGVELTVRGSGFGPEARLFIRGRRVIDQQIVDSETITAIMPPTRAGWADVDVRALGGRATARRLFRALEAPRIDWITPLGGAPDEETLVTLEGSGLHGDSLVWFGASPGRIRGASPDGTKLEVYAPQGTPGDIAQLHVQAPHAEVTIEAGWRWHDVEAPEDFNCQLNFPVEGPESGGTRIALLCSNPSDELTVRFGEEPGLDMERLGELVLITTPPGTGQVPIILSQGDDVSQSLTYRYLTAQTLTLTAVSPSSGGLAGGDMLTLSGTGLSPDTRVFIGALEATEVVYQDDGSLRARSPQGSPGKTTVRVTVAGQEATLAQAWEYRDAALTLDLVTPPRVAQSGGSLVYAHGTGFAPGAQLMLGGRACTDTQVLSESLLVARSPALEPGLWNATLWVDADSISQDAALTVIDPLDTGAGAWGGPIDSDEAIDVTVLSSAYGDRYWFPVPGATVYLRGVGQSELVGRSNSDGQLTLSAALLGGPLDLTATAEGIEASSLVQIDARHVTLMLSQVVPPVPPSQGGGGPPLEPGDPLAPAILQGQVKGLGKYIVPPPGQCAPLADHGSETCFRCEIAKGCFDETHACVDLGAQGSFCLPSCGEALNCPEGMLCMPTSGGNRCIPAPGEKTARCIVTIEDPEGDEDDIKSETWVDDDGNFTLYPERLGEMAIACFGGFRDPSGVFTPSTLGLRRRVFAEPGALMTGLDVTLNHPLSRDLPLRLLDAPVNEPELNKLRIIANLVLGADGTIPMISSGLRQLEGERWLLPHQVVALSDELLDAHYLLKASFFGPGPDDEKSAPVSAQARDWRADALVQDPLPVLEDGDAPTLQGRVDQGRVEADIYAMWAHENRAWAVGEGGHVRMLLSEVWTQQSSPTHHDLKAMTGRAADAIWAAGDAGTLIRWNGTSWSIAFAPTEEDLLAIATAPEQPLFLASETQIWRNEGEQWLEDSPEELSGFRALHMSSDGICVTAGSNGMLARRDLNGVWQSLDTSWSRRLHTVWRDALSDTVIAAGDRGRIIEWSSDGSHQVIDTGEHFAWRALSETPAGALIAVGRGAQIARRVDGLWHAHRIAGFHNDAHALATLSNGSVRILGDSGYSLGPFLALPRAQAPEFLGIDKGWRLGWQWSESVAAELTQIMIGIDLGEFFIPSWTLWVAPQEKEAQLPYLNAPLIEGEDKTMSIVRSRNHKPFRLDHHTQSELDGGARSTWSEQRASIPSAP